VEITVEVNAERRTVDVEPRMLLVHLLRDVLGLPGARVGCDTSNCGACAVLVDGVPVKSCGMLAVMVDGRSVTTVEGLGGPAGPDPLQTAFADAGAVQCGFCTPAMLLVSRALLERTPAPTEDDVRHALAGNLCRCTGYEPIVEAVMRAAPSTAKAAEGAR
jgi:aerobic carbon-monoxide dehydrogenase small subunit